ncbi:hypothetical protein NDU88_004282 [Pleurodeles waltl]|uniref:Uncharacterized protein n=1 Tax=Pleurodeles waltl TaxID=8319 RepID=A0AAV7T6Z6_PLEWA|nr:hypothetical protein NDU88_004282 [Pleurodeles waltl]
MHSPNALDVGLEAAAQSWLGVGCHRILGEYLWSLSSFIGGNVGNSVAEEVTREEESNCSDERVNSDRGFCSQADKQPRSRNIEAAVNVVTYSAHSTPKAQKLKLRAPQGLLAAMAHRIARRPNGLKMTEKCLLPNTEIIQDQSEQAAQFDLTMATNSPVISSFSAVQPNDAQDDVQRVDQNEVGLVPGQINEDGKHSPDTVPSLNQTSKVKEYPVFNISVTSQADKRKMINCHHKKGEPLSKSN